MYVAWRRLSAAQAGLVARAIDYPHGSARLYARESGPRWLHRARVEELVCRQLGIANYSPEAYARVFDRLGSPAERRWLVAAMASPAPADASLDDLLAASPTFMLDWMDERARSADGTSRIVPLTDAESIFEAVRSASLAFDKGV